MLKVVLASLLCTGVCTPGFANTSDEQSVIHVSDDERVLVHREEFDSPLAEIWRHYTDAQYVSRWMAPVAQVDLRTGGSIRTNYDPCATIGGEGTIDLSIVTFVPERFLLLQADLEPQENAAWMNPAIFERREHLFNLVEFEAIGENRSRIISWGLGYGQGKEWDTMIGFFNQGNAWSYGQLRKAIAGETVYPACQASQIED